MTQAPQSSPALRRLPACALACSLAFTPLLAPTLSAQQDARTTREAPFARAVGGTLLGTLRTGAEVSAGRSRSGWTEVTIEGWIVNSSVGRDVRDGFQIGVSAAGGENLRAEPNGRVVARLRYGALLERRGERGKWVRVRRTGWVPRAAVEREVETATAPTAREKRAGGGGRGREKAAARAAKSDSVRTDSVSRPLPPSPHPPRSPASRSPAPPRSTPRRTPPSSARSSRG